MELIKLFVLLIFVFNTLLLVAGLFKPTIAVWWEDIQNRRRVIKIYGSSAVLLAGVYFILTLFQ